MTRFSIQTSKDEYTPERKRDSRGSSEATKPANSEMSEVISFDRQVSHVPTKGNNPNQGLLAAPSVVEDQDPRVSNPINTLAAPLDDFVEKSNMVPAAESLNPVTISQDHSSWMSKVLISARAPEPPVESAFGLHPKVSLVLLIAAMTIAILAAVLTSPRSHQVLALMAGVIYGVLFAPQMRIWHKRPAEPAKSVQDKQSGKDEPLGPPTSQT